MIAAVPPWPPTTGTARPRPLLIVLDCRGGPDARTKANRTRTLRHAARARRVAIWPDEATVSQRRLAPAEMVVTLFQLIETGSGEAACYADVNPGRDHPRRDRTHRQARRTYVLRSHVRCRSCKRRMSGITRHPPVLKRRPGLLKHLLHLPAQPRRPPPHRPRTAIRAPYPSAKTSCSTSSASSSPSVSSDPTAPPCSPPTCPPPPPTTRPAATARPAPSPNGYARSAPPKTPTPARSNPSPTSTTRTPRRHRAALSGAGPVHRTRRQTHRRQHPARRPDQNRHRPRGPRPARRPAPAGRPAR
jgi:hypothetical protein